MLKSILFVLFFSILLAAQEKNNFVAKAGDIVISRSEFQERFHLNPQIGIHRKGQAEANKKVFLYGLIAEKLMSLEAKKNGLDTSAVVKYYLKNFEKMFVRDELYRRVVKVKSAEYADNLLSFYLDHASRIFTKTIISKNKEGLNNIFKMLSKGVPFDSVFYELTPRERDTITLYAGTLDERIEKELFSLPEKHFSKPIQFNENWVIFYIENKSNPVIAKSMGWESEYKRLEKISREKAEDVFYKQYMENLFAGKKADAKVSLILSLAGEIAAIVNESANHDTGSYFLSAADVVLITRNFPADTLNSDFIVLDQDKISLNDFLLWLRTEVYEIKNRSQDRITALLNYKVKKFIEFEILARQGYRLGLEKSENVSRMFTMWKENYLYQLQLSSATDSLLGSRDQEYVKLAELLSNDLESLEKALDEISSGRDFLEIVSEYTGAFPDTSYRQVSSFGEIRDQLLQANIGDIVGPLSTAKGYVIFKVLDKTASENAAGISTGTNKNSIINPFDNYISSLAKKYGLLVNEESLQGIPDSNINAMIFKYLGFGGRIAAVPIIYPISGWYQEWKNQVKPNP